MLALIDVHTAINLIQRPYFFFFFKKKWQSHNFNRFTKLALYSDESGNWRCKQVRLQC